MPSAPSSVITHNTVTGTGFFGFPDTGGFGILLDGSSRNTVDHNVVTGGRGPGIYVTRLEGLQPSVNNVIFRNVANSTLVDGILVDQDASGSRIDRNTANDSGDDGIDIDAPATRLKREHRRSQSGPRNRSRPRRHRRRPQPRVRERQRR